MVTHIVSQFRFLSKLYMCNRVNILSFLNNFLTYHNVLWYNPTNKNNKKLKKQIKDKIEKH